MSQTVVAPARWTGILCGCLIVTGVGNESVRSEEAIRFVPEFDSTKIPAPDATKAAPIARVFEHYIYPGDSELSPINGWDEATGQQLAAILLGDVRQVVRRDPRLQVTKEEAGAFMKAIEATTPEDLRVRKKAGDKEQETADQLVGEMFVGGWKFDRALYRKYGGTVIFQQGNPFEPVGAYAAWIKELTEARIIEVYDPNARKHVWHYFERKHPFVVDPKDVDLDVPWWLQKPRP